MMLVTETNISVKRPPGKTFTLLYSNGNSYLYCLNKIFIWKMNALSKREIYRLLVQKFCIMEITYINFTRSRVFIVLL